MRKLAFGLLLVAAAFGFAAPAGAQGFWLGVGPFGFGIGTGPYYGYDTYWTEPVYAPYPYAYPATPYAYEPAYAYEPYAYYPYGPDYVYAPGSTYASYGFAPARAYRSYAYVPRAGRVHTTVRSATVRLRHHARHVARTYDRHRVQVRSTVGSNAGLKAQASVPVHRIRAHHRQVTVRHTHR